jgi:hypothetical protein
MSGAPLAPLAHQYGEVEDFREEVLRRSAQKRCSEEVLRRGAWGKFPLSLGALDRVGHENA